MSADRALVSTLVAAPVFSVLERALGTETRRVATSGLTGPARAAVLTLLLERTRRKVMLVVPDDAALAAWQRDLSALASLLGRDPRGIVVFPALACDPYNRIPPHPEVERERIRALGRLARRDLDLLLVPAGALLVLLPSPAELAASSRVVRAGTVLAPERFLLDGLRAGYRRVDTVAGPGEISRRGGIIDIYPPEADEPVRIELFGDTIESLRSFDPDHQRSTGALDEAVIGPAAESPATDGAVSRLAAYLEGGLRKAREEGSPLSAFRETLDALRSAGHLPGFEALSALTSEAPSTVFDHASGLALVVDEPERVEDELARAGYEMRAAYEESGDRVLPPPSVLFVPEAAAIAATRDAVLVFRELDAGEGDAGIVQVTWPARRARSFAGRVADLAAALKEAGASGERVLCVLRAPGSAARLAEILSAYELNATIAVAGLREGFEFPEQKLAVYTEREIFGEEKHTSERKSKSRTAFLSDFRDLKVGDLVVHVDHGIARYRGLGRPKGGSVNRDFMILEFQGGDRLFVPTDRLDLVQKYSGVSGHQPRLDKLGGVGWEKVKSKVRKSVESMAKELLELYARRRAATGHAFGPDGPWQGELEAAFPFELTEDQTRAVREVKDDLEQGKPMDRLLVGDVGFGKTEVAVRAAFKAVVDGRQVALLAPTTVLAAQHFETIRERFAPFPVKLEMVSRFRSAEHTRAILRAVAAGEIDMVVGTHRLLSKDVAFKNLGLLVVDEEQRFGVAAKERLKQLSIGIDVLSMTATPIPRTLQMSLAGVRDLSIIETPPPGRSAIQTYLVPFRKNVIAQAIRQELRRQGQVFFVHNRVETIPALVRALKELVPEARVVVAHGQMRESELERVMLRFTHGEADILVTTTLIENGLDIPRANTIIVNRADRLGLAQLYQLRGRVGRSAQHAYAYFLIPGSQTLTDTARRRLKALQEFSELGSGFRLAAADLEIRGAGEFLGSRQHGHIASLGFDLYCTMLEKAVAGMKGEPIEERPPVSLHLAVDIKLPESYMPEVGDRLALYKRLSVAKEAAEVDRLQTETEDRWGHPPLPGRNLFDMARLRLIAERAGVKSVDVVNAKLQVRFGESAAVDLRRLVDLVARRRGAMTPSGMVTLPAPEKTGERIGVVRDILEEAMAGRIRGALCGQRSGLTIGRVTPRRRLVAAAFLLFAAAGCDRFATDPGKRVVAEVGPKSVTVAELQAFLESNQLQDAAAEPMSPGDLARVKSRLFDDYLEGELLFQEAQRRGLTVTDAELAAYVGPEPRSSPAALALARRDLTVQKLRESVVLAEARVDEGEIDAWLAAQTPQGEPAVQGTLRTLRLASYPEAVRVRNEILAKKLSFDEAGLAYGADSLPDAPSDEDLEALPPHIAAAVKALHPGTVSAPLPFESSVLLFLLEKADDPSASMLRRRESARRELALVKAQAATDKLLRELRTTITVTRHPNELPFAYVAEDAAPRAR